MEVRDEGDAQQEDGIVQAEAVDAQYAAQGMEPGPALVNEMDGYGEEEDVAEQQ